MGLNTAETIVEGDFIQQADKNATPANDENKAPKMEADGRLSTFFTRNGAVLNCGETINGATTPVPVYQDKTDNELYACDANDLTKLKFIGFVVSNGTNGNPATFQAHGIVSGFTGLAEGEKYYVQDAVGTISTSPGTYEVLVGVAISETQLLIVRGRRHMAGLTSFSSTTTTTITLGFRPSVVRVFAQMDPGGADVTQIFSHGVYTVGAGNLCQYQCKGTSDEVETGQNSTVSWLVYNDSSDDMHSGVVDTITDTGFRLNNTKAGAGLTATLMWEAEGEL
jgi:hypothetical protein